MGEESVALAYSNSVCFFWIFIKCPNCGIKIYRFVSYKGKWINKLTPAAAQPIYHLSLNLSYLVDVRLGSAHAVAATADIGPSWRDD